MRLKDPSAQLQYGFNWTDWLVTDLGTATITGSTWSVSGPDSALTTTNAGILGAFTVVTLSGGTLGNVYTVTNHITLSTSEVDERSFQIQIMQR